MGKFKKEPTIIVGNINCKLTGVNQVEAGVVANAMKVRQPNYFFNSAYKKGLWDGYIKFFVRPANTFPTGLLPTVLNVLKDELEIVPIIKDERTNVEGFQVHPISENYQVSGEKTARDYQVEAYNALASNKVAGLTFQRGILNLATNAGKTTIAIALIKELYPKLVSRNRIFLFITHSKEIANQTKSAIEKDLGIEVGYLGGGHWDVKPVCVAIVATMFRNISADKFNDISERTVALVADECHHAASKTFLGTLNAFTNASIRVGLTGTVDKKNIINEWNLYGATGEVLMRVSNDYLVTHGYSAKPVCIFLKITEPDVEGLGYHTEYQLGIEENDVRNKVITRVCMKEVQAGHKVLILVEHMVQGQLILQEIENVNPDVKAYFTNGQLNNELRQGLLDAMKDNMIDVLIATSILDEGVDVSNINAVIYARGMKSSRKLLQGIGRGLRKKSDGSVLRFYDFIDDVSVYMLKHSKERATTLKNEGFNMKILDIDTYEGLTWEEINETNKHKQ